LSQPSSVFFLSRAAAVVDWCDCEIAGNRSFLSFFLSFETQPSLWLAVLRRPLAALFFSPPAGEVASHWKKKSSQADF
jgi:hypothetical protein